jgi:hypothetical protein
LAQYSFEDRSEPSSVYYFYADMQPTFAIVPNAVAMQ